jgi:PKD domain
MGGLALMPVGPVAADPGCPSAAASVTVHLLPGTTTQTVTADDLLPDQTVTADYPTRAAVGQKVPISEPVSCGVPISALLSYVGLGASSANFVGIEHVGDNAAGSWSTLNHADLFDPASVYPGGLVPVVRFDGDPANGYTVRYLRPLTADPDDLNVPDKVDAAPGDRFDLYVGDGSLLTVAANAASSHAEVGRPVTFRASSTPSSATPAYTWNFGPGTQPAVGATVSHSFAAAGTYAVIVTAVSPDGSAGTLATPLYVTVGSLPTASPTATPTVGGSSLPSSPRPGSRPTPRATPSGAHSSGGAAPPSPVATPQPLRPAGTAAATPPRVTLQLAGDNLPLVTGQLLGSIAGNPALASPTGQSAGTTVGSAHRGRRIAAGIAAGVAIMLLFAAGAALEARGVRRRSSVGRPG